MTTTQQYKVDQIRVQAPAENQWSGPISYKFGGLRFKSQIALTDLTDTNGRPLNRKTYPDMTLTDILWVVQESGLMVAHHPLYFAISEDRNGVARQAYQSIIGGYYLTGSGIEYFGDKAVLGINPIVADREKGLTRYGHAIHVERLHSQGGEQTLLDERSSWFSRQHGRELKHPIRLWESSTDGLNYVVLVVRSGGYVGVVADWRPLVRGFDWGARLMRNLEVELLKD